MLFVGSIWGDYRDSFRGLGTICPSGVVCYVFSGGIKRYIDPLLREMITDDLPMIFRSGNPVHSGLSA